MNQKNWGNLSDNEREINARQRFLIDQKPVPNWRSSQFYSKYKEIIQELLSRGIKVIMISYPIAPKYSEIAKSDYNFNEIKLFFNEMCESSKDAFYIDLSESVKEQSMFLDQDHLNLKGSKFFSLLLREKLTALKLL